MATHTPSHPTPRRSLFGIESEYGITGFDRDGRVVPQPWLLDRFERAAARLPHLRCVDLGIFLGNGGRLYVDAGLPEYAAPETVDPWNAVRYAAAGDRIVSHLAGDMVRAEPTLAHVIVRKGNVDYAGASSWGSHENYLHSADPDRVGRALVPHLVSRIIYTGGGGFDPRIRSHRPFVLSPRAVFLNRVRALHSARRQGDRIVGVNRALVDTRAEPHSRHYRRQHLICGDALSSHVAQFLRIGTTALVVALAEAGYLDVSAAARMKQPLIALAVVNEDTSLRRVFTLASGQRASAIDVQRRLLEQVRLHLDRLPEWAGCVCDVWQDTLDRLARGPLAVADRLDWAIKWAVFQQRSGGDSPLGPEAAEIVPASPMRDARHLDKAQLCELDLRFGQVSPPSLFEALDEAGVLRHRLAGIERVEDATVTPPAAGRGGVRGRAVTRLACQPGEFVCEWDGITDVGSGTRLDLSDPFAEHEAWRSLNDDRSVEAATTGLLR